MALFFCYQIFWLGVFFLLPAYLLCCRLVRNPATVGFPVIHRKWFLCVCVCVCVHEYVTPDKAPFSPSPPLPGSDSAVFRSYYSLPGICDLLSGGS